VAEGIPPDDLPGWKYRELAGAKIAAGEHRSAEHAAAARVHVQHEAEKDRTAARESWSYKTARYCAGHDWVKERQERTGEIERSR
jgi:hypothetical protein